MLAPETRPERAGLSAAEAMRRLARELAGAGVDDPGRDARLLTGAAMGVAPAGLLLDPERRLTPNEEKALAAFAARRVRREPVSRILGTREFYGRAFRVTPATLDPRPCSETLIDAVLEIADAEGWREKPIRIIDVGTGTGALLLTLLCELPLALGLGTDISRAALDAAAENAGRLGVLARARFAEARSLEGTSESFDVLISNPPYIPAGEIAALEPEVRDFEPRAALDGGLDGLDIYREIASGLARAVPDGWAFFEVGAGQAAPLADILGPARDPRGRQDVRTWVDLGGHTRCVAKRTQSTTVP
jgi:release factor glutamine methyltransferase